MTFGSTFAEPTYWRIAHLTGIRTQVSGGRSCLWFERCSVNGTALKGDSCAIVGCLWLIVSLLPELTTIKLSIPIVMIVIVIVVSSSEFVLESLIFHSVSSTPPHSLIITLHSWLKTVTGGFVSDRGLVVVTCHVTDKVIDIVVGSTFFLELVNDSCIFLGVRITIL